MSVFLSGLGASSELVAYVAEEDCAIETIERRTDQAYRRSFLAAVHEAAHLKRFGEGRIVVILGQSTAGKTSIMGALERAIPGFLGTGIDFYLPMRNAEQIARYAPELYERIAKGLDPIDIAGAVFWDVADEMLRWKSGFSPDEKRDAQLALLEIKEKMRSEPLERTPIEVLERELNDLVIEESQRHSLVAFDPWLNAHQFMRHCLLRNYSASVKVGLAYCPFRELAARVAIRNQKALGEGGDPAEWRPPLCPVMQFLEYYRPAVAGETVIAVLRREEVEEVFEEAFQQELRHELERAAKDPRSARNYKWLRREHERMLHDVMTQLGFTYSDVDEVGITPRFQRFDYLFNTQVLQPDDSAAIIRAWK